MAGFTVEISNPLGPQPLVVNVNADRADRAIIKALQEQWWTLEPCNGGCYGDWHQVTIKVTPPQEGEE